MLEGRGDTLQFIYHYEAITELMDKNNELIWFKLDGSSYDRERYGIVFSCWRGVRKVVTPYGKGQFLLICGAYDLRRTLEYFTIDTSHSVSCWKG